MRRTLICTNDHKFAGSEFGRHQAPSRSEGLDQGWSRSIRSIHFVWHLGTGRAVLVFHRAKDQSALIDRVLPTTAGRLGRSSNEMCEFT